MRGIFFFFFLLLANVFCLEKPVEYNFTFYVKLTCSIRNRENFGFNIQFFDKDVILFNDDDQITGHYINHAPVGSHSFKMTGTLTGDEIFSDWFDVKMVLFHDCNQMNKEVRVDMHLKPLFDIPKHPYDKYYQYEIVKDITDLSGEVTYNGKLVQN